MFFLFLGQIVRQHIPLLGICDTLFLLAFGLRILLCSLRCPNGILGLGFQSLCKAFLFTDLDLLEQLFRLCLMDNDKSKYGGEGGEVGNEHLTQVYNNKLAQTHQPASGFDPTYIHSWYP